MPVEFGMWRLEGSKPVPLPTTGMDNEKRLEDVLAEDITILGLPIMLIGRQVPTATGGYIDLLGIDAGGDIYVIELKRNRTPAMWSRRCLTMPPGSATSPTRTSRPYGTTTALTTVASPRRPSLTDSATHRTTL